MIRDKGPLTRCDAALNNIHRRPPQIMCVNPGDPCDSRGVYGESVARGTQRLTKGMVIDSNTTYDCFVIATSPPSPPACSQPVRVTTLAHRGPSPPTNVGGVVSSMGWGAEWTDAVSGRQRAPWGQQRADLYWLHTMQALFGIPYESQTAFCLSPSGVCAADCSCTAPSVGRNMTVPRGLQHANVLDLQKSTPYNW